MLLVRLTRAELRQDPVLETTLQYALQRGCEQTFQIEGTELAAERIGEAEHRAILLCEATEGGAGVCAGWWRKPTRSPASQEALIRCHFDEQGNDLKPECQAACYECLMSFANQLKPATPPPSYAPDPAGPHGQPRPCPALAVAAGRHTSRGCIHSPILRSALERCFLDALAAGHLRLPDEAQKAILEPHCIQIFLHHRNICVFCDGSVHDHSDQVARDTVLRSGSSSGATA